MRWFNPVVWPLLIVMISFLVAQIGTDHYSRVQNVDYFYDFDGTQTIESISSAPFQWNLKKTIPPKAQVIWLRLPIPDQLNDWKEDAVIFTGSNETAHSMQAFIKDSAGIEDLGTCDVAIESAICPLPTLQYAFPINKVSRTERMLYIKLTPGVSGINNEFYFMTKTYFNRVTIFLVHFIGLSSGIFLLVALLAFIFYRSLKEPSFLIYGLFYLNLLFSTAFNRGIWDAFKPDSIIINGSALLFPFLVMTVFFDLLFLRVFFDMPTKHPKLNKIYLSSLAALVLLIAVSLFPFAKPLAWKLFTPAVNGSMVLAGLTLIYFVWQGRIWAEPVAMAWGVAIVCNLIWIAFRSGQIEGFWFFGYYAIFGRMLEALILNTVIFQKLQKLTMKVGFAQAQSEEGKVAKTLLRTLSHDLSNTTQLMKYSAQLILENPDSKNVTQNLNHILYAANQQVEIIENAKANYFVRGQRAINLTPVDLKNCIEEVVSMFQNKAKKKNIQIVMKLSDGPTLVMAEKTSLCHQVLANLLSNSIKFSYPDKVITISSMPSEPGYIELIIKDEGVGISNQQLDRLFDESEAVSQPGTAGEIGTGHGLLIVRDFLSLYGATIKLDSTIDHGVTVTLKLKLFST